MARKKEMVKNELIVLLGMRPVDLNDLGTLLWEYVWTIKRRRKKKVIFLDYFAIEARIDDGRHEIEIRNRAAHIVIFRLCSVPDIETGWYLMQKGPEKIEMEMMTERFREALQKS